jgi:hypothetical protein
VDESLIAYLQEHQGDAKYLVAVQAASESVPIILATGEPVVTLGGYKSRDPVPTVAELESMVASGEVRYVFLTNQSEGSVRGSPAGISTGTMGSSAEVLENVVDWVIAHGDEVPVDEYGGSEGTLYCFAVEEGS